MLNFKLSKLNNVKRFSNLERAPKNPKVWSFAIIPFPRPLSVPFLFCASGNLTAKLALLFLPRIGQSTVIKGYFLLKNLFAPFAPTLPCTWIALNFCSRTIFARLLQLKRDSRDLGGRHILIGKCFAECGVYPFQRHPKEIAAKIFSFTIFCITTRQNHNEEEFWEKYLLAIEYSVLSFGIVC